MDLTSIRTQDLVEIGRTQAQQGKVQQELLVELGNRFGYRDCPQDDKALIAEFDRTVTIPILGRTALPPGVIHLPGATPQTVPVYYQKNSELSVSSPKPATESKASTEQMAPSDSAKRALRAFISYSHKDADVLNKLHEHLSGLKRQGLLDTWTDQEIHPGGIIDQHVDEQIENADLYLLLVSSAFIQSDYCFKKEFVRACERQSADKAMIVPIIIRDCDWKIPELRQFKALPDDGKPVMSRHWHSPDEAFANVAAGLRKLLERGQSSARKSGAARKAPKEKFIPDERHITEEQRAELRKLCDEIVDRLTAKSAAMSEEELKKKKGRYYGIVWSQFNEKFGTVKHGLPSLPRERYEEARLWMIQYRASKDKNFKRANPQKYRNTLTKGIYTLVGKLGWSKEELYAFASNVVGYADPISTLDSLGNNQLEVVRDKVRYENTKRKAKAAQAKARHL